MPVIKVAYNPDFAPFSKRGDGKPQGLIIERLKEIFATSNIQFNFIATNLPELIPNMEKGKVDAVAALGITPERQEKYQFTKPIIVSGGAWFIPKSNRMLAEGEVPTSVITPERGPLANEIKNKYPEIDLITCADYNAAFKGALEGKALAAALNWHVGRMMVEDKYQNQFHETKRPYNTLALGLAVLKKNSDLITHINKNIPDDWGYDLI